MNRLVGIWKTAALVCVAVLLSAVACSSASAQVRAYSVYANCNRADGWSPSASNSNWAAYNDCGGWRPGLKAYVVPNNDARTDTGSASWLFRAPAGTRIGALEWDGYKYHGVTSGGWLGGGWSFRTSVFGDGLRSIDAEGTCDASTFLITNSCYAGAFSDPGPKAVPSHYVGGINESVVGFGVSCVPSPNPCAANSDGMNSHGYTRAALALQNVRVDLVDDTDPVIRSVNGAMSTTDWTRGVIDLGVSADDNSGVCNVVVDVDGIERRVDPQPRDNFSTKPCADLSKRYQWDTSGWPDGEHRVKVDVSDAADRVGPTGTWGWHSFWTDNNAPPGPKNLSIDGGEGWSSVKHRTIRWTNPPKGAGSAIAGAQLQMCKVGTTTCNYSDHTSDEAISGIGGFDGPGDYTLRVSLKDSAGNHDRDALSNAVHLRFDDQLPGAADPSKSNGWLNAVERAGFQQHVQMGIREFKPASGIAGYSLTTDGSTPDNTVDAPGLEADLAINDLPEGVNTVKARAVSGAGLASAVVNSVEVKVDLTRPTAVASGAPNPNTWQNRPVDIVLQGEDQPDLSGMEPSSPSQAIEEGAYVAYRIDDGPPQKVRGASAPVTVADEGEHTITYYAVDFAGNGSETKTVQFKIDRTSPTTNATSDAVDASVWQRESVSVTLNGDDGQGRSGMDPAPEGAPIDSGAYLAYRLDAGEVQLARGPSATFRVDADGDHAVSYYAVDGAGNESDHKTVQFRIDKTAPRPVTIESPGSDKRRLEVDATDATSGVGEVQIGLRRVGSNGQANALRRLASRNRPGYRRTKLRQTRRVGNRLADCHRMHGFAKRACLKRRRRQLANHRIVSLGEDWRMLPATRQGDKWVAVIPSDRSFVEGVYQLQAVAQDQAGNESSSDKFRSGQPAIIPIQSSDQPGCCTPDPGKGGDGGGGLSVDPGPVGGIGGGNAPSDLGPDNGTVETKIAAGAVKKVKVKAKLPKYCKKPKTSTQKKKCAKARKPRYRNEFVNKLQVAFGKKAAIKGSLTTTNGAPIADGTIDVVTTPNATGQQARVVGAVNTNSAGAFSYTAPAGVSRKVSFRFRGLREFRRSEGTVDLLVPAPATLKPSKRVVANGQSVTFTGRLRGKPLPARGKVVDLQVFYRGKWRTFATPRANKKGAFKFRYRFEATRRTTTYKFRARVRAESAYPYELGYSKTLNVRVRGR